MTTTDDGAAPPPLQSPNPPPRPAAAGAWGERRAEDFLRRERGFRVLARNWRSPRDRRDEIDLVALDGEALVFVEVKTRSARALVPGYFAVDPRKRRALGRAVRAYLGGLSHPPRTFRLDIVEVAPGPDGAELRHFENAGLFSRARGVAPAAPRWSSARDFRSGGRR